MPELHAPFPYIGGKRRVAKKVWAALGNPRVYVEPFAGSLGVLLGRPRMRNDMIEHVNDLDGHVANFWRSARLHPQRVAEAFDLPPVEWELQAAARALNESRESIGRRLAEDEKWCDPELAGRWAWRMSVAALPKANVTTLGKEVGGTEVVDGPAVMFGLQQRLRRVRVYSGDWKRTIERASAARIGQAAFFLDPPYGASIRTEALYAVESDVADECGRWAAQHHYHRIVVAGREGEHDETLRGWRTATWKSVGMGGSFSECLWISPACNG